jgi:chromosome segregation ATPase
MYEKNIYIKSSLWYACLCEVEVLQMKKNGKTPKIYKTDLGQKTRVLLEEVRHGLKTVAEGHGLLTNRLDGHDKKLNEISDVVRKIDTHYFKLQMDTESIKSQMGTIDIKTDRIERDVSIVKSAIMDVSHEIKDHEKRIKKVEEKIFI